MTPSKIIINRITIMKLDSHLLKRTNLLILLTSLFLMACSGGGGTPTATDITAEATEVPNGSITPFSFSIATPGDRAFFTVTPNPNFQIGSVVGCSGELVGNTYTTGPLSASCTVTTSFTKITVLPADAATPILSYVQTKLFQFTWTDVADATFYRLMEQAKTGDGFTQVGPDIAAGVQAFDHIVTLYDRLNAQYILQSCNIDGCTDAPSVSVSGNLAGSIGYFKTSNTGSGDNAGESVSLSADGNTLAVGAKGESSNATGILDESGAVYVFTLSGTVWSQQAYLKASNPGQLDEFGGAVSLSEDGNTLAVGATGEDSNATGVGVDDGNDSAENSGAVYVFRREPGSTAWRQQAYLKASNTGAQDSFGKSVSVDGNGLSRTIAVGAHREDSDGSDEDDDSAENSGAVYVFFFNGSVWRQQAYLKASNVDANDQFGGAVSLSGDSVTLAVGATGESSNEDHEMIGFPLPTEYNEEDNTVPDSGAVYVFKHSNAVWRQQAYLKAQNSEAGDQFGGSVSLDFDGNTLAVGATGEDSNITGVVVRDGTGAGFGGDQNDNSALDSGAVYVFTDRGALFQNSTLDGWLVQSYIKASNNTASGQFGGSVSLSGNNRTLAVGAAFEASSAIGVNGNPSVTAGNSGGAVYVFESLGSSFWNQKAYLKASNGKPGDLFGFSVSLNLDGTTLVSGAPFESTNASGAVYLY
jgi:hypothetical protein